MYYEWKNAKCFIKNLGKRKVLKEKFNYIVTNFEMLQCLKKNLNKSKTYLDFI